MAAAVVGHADGVLTRNRKHFPDALISPLGIEVIDPDNFIVNQWDPNPLAAIGAVKEMRARRRKLEQDTTEFADALERNDLPLTADRIRGALKLL